MSDALIGPIRSVRIGVSDLSRSRAFFRDLIGLAEIETNQWIVRFETGGASLVLEPAGEDEDDRARLGLYSGVMFDAPDAQRAFETLSARGVPFLGPPEKMPWGAIFAHFTDPDGTIFTLCQYPD